MKSIRLLDPEKAIIKASQEILKYGFFAVNHGKESRYYAKKGSNLKIRISNHKRDNESSDIIVHVIFDTITIINDVEVRIKQAVNEYERQLRLRRSKRYIK